MAKLEEIRQERERKLAMPGLEEVHDTNDASGMMGDSGQQGDIEDCGGCCVL